MTSTESSRGAPAWRPSVNTVDLISVDDEGYLVGDGDFAEALKGLMALPRYARSEEIASFVAYLAGPEAAYITGASLTIDGGFSA